MSDPLNTGEDFVYLNTADKTHIR